MKFDKLTEAYLKVVNENFEEVENEHVSLLHGELVVDVNGTQYKIVIQESGDFDFEGVQGNTISEDDPNFGALSSFAYSLNLPGAED